MSLYSESAGLESISKVFYWICIQIHLLTNLWDRCVHLLSRHGSIFRKCWFTGILHKHLWDSQRKYQLCGSCASSWCSTKVRKEQLCVAHTCNTLKGYSSRRFGVNAVRYTQETGCSLHRLIKIGQQKIGETSPGLMSLEFLSLEGMGDQKVV